jgi:NADH-quinone oxidoreductase subunit J
VLTQVVFWVAAVWVVAMSIIVVAARNPVHSAVALVANMVGLGALFLLLHAEFLAVVEILVYAGAVMVLFLFVVTLLMAGTKPPAEGRGQNLPGQVPVAVGLAAVLLALAAWTVAQGRGPVANVANAFGSIASFGLALFTKYLLPFELTALVLLVAIVGVVVLGRDTHEG